MSQENVENVRRVFQALSDGDLGGLLGFCYGENKPSATNGFSSPVLQNGGQAGRLRVKETFRFRRRPLGARRSRRLLNLRDTA